VCGSEGRRVNGGTASKLNGDVQNGFVRRASSSSEPRRRTELDELPMRSVLPPDVVSSQRRARDVNITRAAGVYDDSLEVTGDGVDNPGYADDTGSDTIEVRHASYHWH